MTSHKIDIHRASLFPLRAVRRNMRSHRIFKIYLILISYETRKIWHNLEFWPLIQLEQIHEHIHSLMWVNSGTQDILHLEEPFLGKRRDHSWMKKRVGAWAGVWLSSTEGEVPLRESSWSLSAFSHLTPSLLGLELRPLFLHPGPIPPVQVLDCQECPVAWGTT